MKKPTFKYFCNLCQKETDYSGVIGLALKDGELDYVASISGDAHICISCWHQIETIQKNIATVNM